MEEHPGDLRSKDSGPLSQLDESHIAGLKDLDQSELLGHTPPYCETGISCKIAFILLFLDVFTIFSLSQAYNHVTQTHM